MKSVMGPLRRAKYTHFCTHCRGIILPKMLHVSATIPPWEQPAESDRESYIQYHSHLRCDLFWLKIADESDWLFWENAKYWLAMMAEPENPLIPMRYPGSALDYLKKESRWGEARREA